MSTTEPERPPRSDLFKMMGFCIANPNLTHEEYCLGHGSFHVGLSRRMPGVLGYVLNCRVATRLEESHPALDGALSIAEPADADAQWNGVVEWWNPTIEAYFAAINTPIKDVPGDEGMEYAESLRTLTTVDARRLFYGTPFQPEVRETVVLPVTRGEYGGFKAIQFVKRAPGLELLDFEDRWVSTAKQFCAGAEGVRGYTFSLRDDERETYRGFFADWQVDYSLADRGAREKAYFFSLWDGVAMLYFDSAESFVRFRLGEAGAELRAAESELCSVTWHREVTEVIGVLPTRVP